MVTSAEPGPTSPHTSASADSGPATPSQPPGVNPVATAATAAGGATAGKTGAAGVAAVTAAAASGSAGRAAGSRSVAAPELRHWRWGETARAWTAGVAAVLLAVVAAVAAMFWYGTESAGLWLLIASVVAGAGGAALGFIGGEAGGGPAAGVGGAGGAGAVDVSAVERRRLSVVLLISAGLLGALGAWAVLGTPTAQLAGVAGAVALVLVVAGVSTAAGRSGLIGACAVVATAGLWEIGLWLGDARAAGIVLGPLSVLVLGYVPRMALLGSGLTRLDDQRSLGTSVRHLQVDTALAVNHRMYAPVTVTVALSAVAGGWLVLSELTPWAVALALLLVVLLCSRARAYPLTFEIVVMGGAAVVLLVRLSALWAAESATGPMVVLVALAFAPLVTLVAGVLAPVRARLRQLMNLVESLSVVLLAPVVLGAFGTYGALLNLF